MRLKTCIVYIAYDARIAPSCVRWHWWRWWNFVWRSQGVHKIYYSSYIFFFSQEIAFLLGNKINQCGHSHFNTRSNVQLFLSECVCVCACALAPARSHIYRPREDNKAEWLKCFRQRVISFITIFVTNVLRVLFGSMQLSIERFVFGDVSECVCMLCVVRVTT